MINRISTTLLFICLAFSSLVLADEMVIVQTVATDKQTFVIRRGFKDGIGVGQESLFSTTKVSLAARAVEVNREYSLWKILEESYAVPFRKDQIVNYISSIESVDIQIPEIKKRKNEFFFDPARFWYFRTGISRTINQNLSDAPEGTDKARQGMQFDVLVSFNFTRNWEFGIGGRFDIEEEVIEQGNLAIPSSRFFLMTELIYQLDYFRGKKSNFYLSGAFGIGQSQTQVDDKVSTGTAFVSPAVRLGWQKKYYNKWWFVVEGLVESISSVEKFSDSDPQESNFTNIKAIMGIKF